MCFDHDKASEIQTDIWSEKLSLAWNRWETVGGNYRGENRNEKSTWIWFSIELNLSLIDLCFPDSVGFTYLGHDGSKSWLDHIAVSNCFCSSVVSVHSIRGGKNLSDHNPLAFSLDLSTPVAPCTTSTPDCPSVRCHLATSEDICRYQQAVQCSLVSLSSLLPNHVVLCREPYCNARRGLHQACFLT